MEDRISISKEPLDEIISHCKKVYPDEACGILAGKGNAVEKVYKMTNIKNSSVSYEMDPMEQLRCEKEIRKAGLKIICIYHSHPHSSAYPSQMDIARVYWPGDPDMPIYPDAFYMIIGPINGNTEVRVFKLYPGGKIEEIKLDIKRG
jgi:proteasome lid subunit RPN8/RPN11